MRRRTFLKSAAVATLTSRLGSARFLRASPVAQARRIAWGGIQIECSTYGHIRARMEEFTVTRGHDLAEDPFFRLLKAYPYPYQPTLLATAVPGGPVERKTYDELKTEFLQRLKALLPLDRTLLRKNLHHGTLV